MDQLIAHLIGDYTLQSNWMAACKRKSIAACIIHCSCYILPFTLISQSWPALLVIFSTHLAIDHYGLARYVAWAANHLTPNGHPRFSWCSMSGCFDPEIARADTKNIRDIGEICTLNNDAENALPVWRRMWLLTIHDNALHLLINWLALKYC